MNVLLVGVFVLVSVFTCSLYATPWGLPGEAFINAGDGKMYICPTGTTDKDVSVSSVIVSASFLRHGKKEIMWDINNNNENLMFSLKPGDCISYGSQADGYTALVTAKPLEVGKTYYARINAHIAQPTRLSILFYDAVFCVGIQEDGEFIYRQYQYPRTGETIRPDC